MHFFTVSNIYIAPRQGHTTTCYKFWQHFKAFIIPIILYQFQKDPFCLIILYDILFYFKHVYIVLGRGKITPWGQNFDVDRKALSLCQFIASLKEISLKSDFIHIFHAFIHVYSTVHGFARNVNSSTFLIPSLVNR